MNIFPFRLRFTKCGRLRFLSHHDLMRLLERAIRRTELPIKMTEGFNPHPRISFPVALALGIESLDEIMEIELASWVKPQEIENRLNAQLLDGIKITKIEPFDRKIRTYIDFVDYEVFTPMDIGADEIKSKIENFLKQEELIMERHSDKGSKLVDIRKYVLNIKIDTNKLLLRIRNTDSGTAKPEEVVKALGIEFTPTTKKTLVWGFTSDMRICKTYSELKVRE